MNKKTSKLKKPNGAKPFVMRRFIIAVDSVGVHFRKTLCVTHHGESGEVTYDAKPIFSTRDKSFKKKLIELVKSANGA